jgi:hypothetical protein
MNPTTNLNQYLQQVGMPPMRVAANQLNHNPNDPNNPAAAEIRAIPLRALLMPLMMLTFRTFLLMYFFSPSKRPFFGLLLSVWILYETWGALRGVLGHDRPAPGQAQAQGRVEQGAGGDQAQNPQRGQAALPGSSQNDNRGQLDWIYNYLATMDLSTEESILDGTNQAREPSMTRKVKSFVSLFLMSLHPAVWDRRRATLRRREGRLRTEGNVRQSAPPAEGAGEEDANRAHAREQVIARHERRPQWVQRYVDRVQETEWADDI